MADSRPSDSKPRGPSESSVIETALICREFPNGDMACAPVADSSLVSHGSESSAIETQHVFLAEYLLSVRPDVLARFIAPDGIALREIDVVLRRYDLPRRVQLDMPITFACVLVPYKRDHWVIVPTLTHTFYVARGEDIDEVSRREIRRVVLAGDYRDEAYLRLFPAESHELELTAVEIEHKGEGIQGRAGSLRKKLITEHRRKEAAELLDSVAIPLHEEIPEQLPRLIARDRQLGQLSALYGSSDRRSVIFVGPSSAGKTALVHAWLADTRRARGLRPGKRRKGKAPGQGEVLVYSTSVAQLIAGMSGLGEWQERVTRVMDAVELLDAVLYFENLSELFGERPERGGVNASGLMRRYIVDARVRVFGEILPEGLDAVESRHVALLGAFNRIRVEPLEPAQTHQALHARIEWWNRHEPRRPRVSPEIVDPVIELAERYMPYRAFPGKAIRFVDELRAMASDAGASGPRSDSERAARKEARKAAQGGGAGSTGAGDGGDHLPVIDLARAHDGFSLSTGIPAFLLREDRALLTDEVIARFRQRMVGQHEAVRRVIETICVVKARMQPAGKPLCTFLFVGPTGVGKTELARTLAQFLFGSTQRMVRFDMSEYTDPMAAERLIGGTFATGGGDGLLTSKVREQPFCVLLLDEIEKAHPAVFDLLLQVCGEGRLTDARGKVAYFHNAIIIMTSNLGAAHRRSSLGIAARSRTSGDHYLEAVQQAFRPELINRLDRVIAFSELTPEEVREVTRIATSRVVERRGIAGAGIELDISERALDLLARSGYSETYGVRALRRHLDDFVVSPIARILARLGTQAKGCRVRVTTASDDVSGTDVGSRLASDVLPLERLADGDERPALTIEAFRRGRVVGRRALSGMAALAEVRRSTDYYLGLDRCAGVKEHLTFLRSQLATAASPGKSKKARRKRRQALDIGALQTEYYRLSQLWNDADQLRHDIQTAEELGLTALFDGEGTEEWVEEANELYESFTSKLLWLLLARQQPRDEATVIVTDIQGAGLLKFWLRPLINDLSRRRWTLWGHVPGSRTGSKRAGSESDGSAKSGESGSSAGRDAGDGKWPAERLWSPPRDAAWLQNQTLHGPSPYREVLLRVRGPNAGILLALEAGLHRFRGFSSAHDPAHMLVTLVAMRTSFTDKEWIDSILADRPVERGGGGSRGDAVRERFRGTDELRVVKRDGRMVVPSAEYWKRMEDIALEHLLYHVDGPDGEERDEASQLFVGALPAARPTRAEEEAAATAKPDDE